ncbi:MAG: HAD-IC family P-type ATPase [Clostridia bacterium]|nr:HAD-IC family P-type ATPase [Clostridia bacterium]
MKYDKQSERSPQESADDSKEPTSAEYTETDYLDEELHEEDSQQKSGLLKKKKKDKNAPLIPLEKLQRFNARADEGLSSEQVEERIQKGYVNKTVKKFTKTYRSIFRDNICTFFNLLCLIAALALLLAHAPISQFLFVPIFVCNMTIGIVQEIRAKRKIDKLSILSSPIATVVRNGKKQDIPVDQLVVDDVLILSAGQQVPADCIALDGNAELNESLLTGESVPIKKEDGDLLYAGSFVASGRIAVRVDKIGQMTYISKLTSRAKKYKRPNSEIMNSIGLFIKVVGGIIIPVAIAMFIVNYQNIGAAAEELSGGSFLSKLFNGDPVISATIQKTASVVIGMIPSGLILLTTVALSVGMIRLAKYNTLVQDMYSLEMLARVNVLCLDKTGTITDGRMKVSDCVLLNNPTEYSMDDIMGSMLASLNDNNQTSIALYERFGHSAALQPIATLPFSSARKLSAVTFEGVGTFVMGAPEFVLKPVPVRIDKIVKQYAQMGLRVLILAHAPAQLQGDKVPSGLRAISIITLVDNIRPDAIETIKWFRENDVDVKVISGDNPVTVAEVARRAGIKNASHFISLEGLSPLEVENAANQYTVFGRVTPEQKAILIRAIKKAGNTVAMTGDGVNDILAMKEADCAVSVASGSEAARNVSNLVLQDNNFASMPKIVNEGRRVINNIKDSSALYVMKSLLILTLSLFCILTKSEYFFTTNNMLMFEFFISAIPSFVLSLQPNTNRVKGKFIPYVLSRAIPGALTMAIGILSLYIVRQTGLSDEFGFSFQNVETAEYHAVMMVVLTFSGLVMLYRVCQPFNVVRVILFVLMASLCVLVLVVPYFGEVVFTGWSDIHVTLPQLLLVIIIVQASFPLSGFLIKFFDMFNDADETA